MRSRQAEEIDLDFYAQEEIYKRETGDRHWYIGFDAAFGNGVSGTPS